MLKINYNYFLTFIITSLFIFSINVNPNRLFDDNPSILNYFRFFFPIIGVIFISFFFKLNFSKLSLSSDNKIIFFIFIIFLLNDLFIGITANLLYYINFFSFFIYILLIKNFNNRKLLIYNLYFTISVYLISILCLIGYKFFFTSIYQQNLSDIFFNLRNFIIFHEDESALSNNPSINSTGVSRVILILAVILIYYDLVKKNLSIILSIILFCLSLFLLSLQSKFSIISIIIVYILLLCGYKTYTHKKVLNIIFVIFLPFFLYNFSSVESDNRINKVVKTIINEQIISRDNIINKDKINKDKINKDKINEDKFNEDKIIKDKIIKDKINKDKENIINKEIPEELNKKKIITDNIDISTQFTTGRNKIWRNQIEFISNNENFFLGKGIYADLKIFNTSSSNAILYTFLCGGLISAILLIILYVRFAIQYFIYLYKKIFSIKQNIEEIYFFIILIILLRSLIENSFMSIQFDFYLIIILIEILNFRKKIK